MLIKHLLGIFLLVASPWWQPSAQAQTSPDEANELSRRFIANAQATHVVQFKPAFDAAYSGPNSLSTQGERSYSTTATVFLGWRLGANTELFFNPEMAAGVRLSRLTGMGGLSNGELARTSGEDPVFYRARLFMRHTINISEATEQLSQEANQFAHRLSQKRFTITAGNFSVLDVFDKSAYAKDPRTQFLNWALIAPGAWDFAADARGYTWGVAADYTHGPYTFVLAVLPSPGNPTGYA
jgi:high affinity Mn2+ porin